MRKFSKRFFAGMLVLVCTLSMSACKKEEVKNENNEGAKTEAIADGGTTTSTSFEVEKNAEVRVATWESDMKFWDLIVQGFKEQYPDIKLTIELNSEDDKLLTQAASGTSADVWQISERARAYAKENVFLPLDDYIAQSDKINPDMFIPDIYNNCIVDGQVKYLPKDYGIQGIYLNKNLFAEAGVEIPTSDWTTDEFREIAKSLTKFDDQGRATQWGVFTNGTWDIPLDAIAEQFGGGFVSDDGETFDGYLNGPKTIEAFKWYFGMIAVDKSAPNTEQSDSFSGMDAFEAGKAAMAWQGSWKADAYKNNPNLDLMALPLPKGVDGSRANHITWAAFGMSKDTKYPNATWKFLEYQCGAEGSEILAPYAFPVVKSVVEKVGIDQDPILSVFYKAALEDATPYMSYYNPWWELGINQYVGTAIEKFSLDPDIDMQKELDDAVAKMTKEWSNKKQQLIKNGVTFE